MSHTVTYVTYHFMLVSYILQSGEYNYRGLFHAVQEIRKKEGFRGFTRGLGPTLIRDVPFSGVHYLFYTRIKTFAGNDH